MKPAVSIVVPIYNVEKYLDRCMKSLINQTLKNIEIIMVDDGSPDNCPDICDSYFAIDNRVKVVHKQNAGLGMARNTGIDLATGEYIAFVDSDDFVELNMYEKLYEVAKKETADVVISGGFIDERKDGTTHVNNIMNSIDIFEGNTKQLALEMLGSKPEFRRDYIYEPSSCKGIYKLSIVNDNNIRFHSERELISEDYVFHLDLFQVTKKAICIPECYYHYCQNETSLTKIYREDRFLRNVQFYKYITKRLLDLQYSREDLQYANRILLAWARVAISQISAHYMWHESSLRNEILAICTNEELQEVLEHYPIHRLPLKQRLFVINMKFKCWKILYMLSVINNRNK